MPVDKYEDMAFKIYRFEIIDEVSRHGANVIYNARDTVASSELQLYEWTPPLREASSAAAMLDGVGHELDGVEVFSSGTRLYLAAVQDQARKALEKLRVHGLFPGSWLGLFEDFSDDLPADDETSGSEPQSGVTDSGRPSRPLLGILGTLVVILSILSIGLIVYSANISNDRDAKEATIRNLSNQLDDHQRTIDSLNAEIKQKDDLLMQHQISENQTARTIFRLAEENVKATSEYIGLALENECSRGPVFVVVRYLSLHGVWVTRGWWKIDYGQKIEPPDVYSKDGVFYVYAENRNPLSTWNGSQESDSLPAEVVDDGFLRPTGKIWMDPINGQ